MLKEILMTTAHKSVEFSTYFATSATKLSKVMDVAGGGPKVHGGFHRIFGGHNFWDIDLWTKHGIDFPKELFKDFITPNGLPLPGTKELIEKLGASAQTAQEWGCINIGEFLGGGISIVDTVKKIKSYKDNPEAEIEQSEYISLLLKIAISTSTTNPIMAASAFSDATLLMKKHFDKSFEGSFEYNPIFSFEE